MIVYPHDFPPLQAPDVADQGSALEEFAAAFAYRDPIEAEEMIESLCCEAIRLWRLQEATFWQRVKFRARMLRAMAPLRADLGAPSNIGNGSQ